MTLIILHKGKKESNTLQINKILQKKILLITQPKPSPWNVRIDWLHVNLK